jgi:hypothetical protein
MNGQSRLTACGEICLFGALVTLVCLLPLAAAQSQEAPAAEAVPPVAMRVDEFSVDGSVRIREVEGKTVIGILKRALEKSVEAEPGFELSTTAPLALTGAIRELTITERRRGPAGEILQRSAQVRVDFDLIDEGTGRPVVQGNNVIEELTYYTDTYSLEQGMTDREALEENLLPALGRRIMALVAAESATLPRPSGKQVELTDEEREVLEQIGAPPEERKPLFSWNLGFENEATTITEGTLAAAGQPQRTVNRFLQNTTVKLNPQQIGGGELRGLVTTKYRPEDVRELTLQRGELEYQVGDPFLLRAGTVSQTMNKYIFDQTLLGAVLDLKFGGAGGKHNFVALGGHDWRADGIGDLPRVNYGGFWKSTFGEWAEIQLTGNATRDRHSTRNTSGAIVEVENRIFGVSGAFRTPWKTELTYDAHRSENKDPRTPDTSFVTGDVLDLKLTQPIRSLTLTGTYYNADERFRTHYGSATTDREKLGVNAELPGTWRWIDYNVTGGWTRSNRVARRTLVEQLGEAALELTETPWAEGGSFFLKNLELTQEGSLRRTYDDVVVLGTAPGSNRRNLRYALGASNTLWDAYKVMVNWSDERERDLLRFEVTQTQEFKWENTYTRDVAEGLNMELKANYRSRDGGRDQDRFYTVGGTLAYERNAFTARFDYLRDIKRGTVKAQDTDKDRYTVDLSYSNERGAFKNTFTLRSDYEVNAFDNPLSDYDRWVTTIGLKVIF